MKIRKNGKYQTRDGRKVRIYAVDGEAELPVHGAFLDCGVWIAEQWRKNGKYYLSGVRSDTDLTPAKKRKK